jgi:hypothetical protein
MLSKTLAAAEQDSVSGKMRDRGSALTGFRSSPKAVLAALEPF